MALLTPPPNFGMVEDGLYRSGMPTEASYPFLCTLKLKKIIYLAPEDVPQQLASFARDENIVIEPLGLESRLTPWKPISEDVVIGALTLILDPAQYPMLIMCHLGRHRTGTVVGCLRRLQRWSLASIFAEYRRYAGSKVRPINEQFVELFDTDLVRIPQQPPRWLRVARPASERASDEAQERAAGAADADRLDAAAAVGAAAAAKTFTL